MKHLFLVLLLVLTACENPIKKGVRDATYSAYELVGVQKRDLLKKRISQTQEDQKEAGESFESALDRLQKMYGISGGELEKQYRSVQSAYDDSAARVKDVKRSRENMQTVARDLFREWENEIGEIKTAEYKEKSAEKLKDTQTRFEDLNKQLATAEKKMDPVLDKLRDHVLYLKHNLNAKSIASLKTEHGRIEKQIEDLVRDMKGSISKADGFIKTLE